MKYLILIVLLITSSYAKDMWFKYSVTPAPSLMFSLPILDYDETLQLGYRHKVSMERSFGKIGTFGTEFAYSDYSSGSPWYLQKKEFYSYKAAVFGVVRDRTLWDFEFIVTGGVGYNYIRGYRYPFKSRDHGEYSYHLAYGRVTAGLVFSLTEKIELEVIPLDVSSMFLIEFAPNLQLSFKI